ncbi:hypothetical protein Athai_06600 [Actinocatenispora thailandica]|uniref:Uncharacterized protein n=1 Tax=Actinocatenispora thailandica TaxID=227318 RepID=A0A7R7HUN3_9ACTN|nr:hypothetical protein [Actinocatenispora thailandica]BCJ33157.1 hypothetical protein Athai_06600 [Actinocatenispora thailandica]
MNEDVAWWLGDGDWYDRRQRQQIEDLDAAISGAYAQSSRLRSRLSAIEGNLSAKVNRIAAAFDAFVELSDIRAELMVYSKPAVVRHAVRELIGQLSAGATVVPPDLPEVPGYWLVPATRALYAQLTDDDATAARHIEQATELDGPRTRYFLTAALRLAGPVDLSAVQLAALLPAPGGPVTRSARAMWRATAAGAFGSPGTALLVSALVSALGRPDAGTGPVVPEPRSGAQEDGPADPAGEAERPDRLPAWLTAIGGSGSSAGSVATALAGLAKRCTAPSEEPAGTDPAEPLREILAALIDEGHEPERPLLRRAEKLRSLVESGLPRPEFEPWDEPVGSVDELVRQDIFGSEPGPLRAPAVRAALPWLGRAADTLVAGVSAPPRARTARIRGREVTVTASGADATVLDQLRAERDASHRTSPTRLIAGLAVAGAGLVAGVIGIVAASTLLVVLGVLALLVGVGVAISGWRSNTEAKRYAELDHDALERSIASQVDSLRQTVEQDNRDRALLDRARAELSEVLAQPVTSR